MNIAIISSTKDIASTNIKEQLLNNFDFQQLKETFDNNPVFQYSTNNNAINEKNSNNESNKNDNKENNNTKNNNNEVIKIYTINSELIHTDDLDKKIDADVFIFISKHRAEEGRASLTVHPIGNFGKNEVGGKEKTLCISPAFLLKNIFLELSNNAENSEYDATLEATHHGPYIEKPVLFLELGSNEKYWKDKNGANIVAKSLINAIKQFNDKDNPIINNNLKNKNNGNEGYESCFVIGGGHYNHVANKAMQKSELGVGHILPKYNLDNLDEEMLKQIMDKIIPMPKFALLDWKGLGKEKQKILELLNKNDIKYERSDKFF